jgi:WD40 repeat protein
MKRYSLPIIALFLCARLAGAQSTPFADAKVIHSLPWKSDAVTSVAFLGNDKIAAANKRGDILVWNLPASGEKSPDPVRRLVGHKGAINRLLATPDGKTLISVSNDRTVRFWDALKSDGEPGTIVLNDGIVRVGVSEKVAKLPDPPPPITANVVVQKPLRELIGHKEWIWGLALSRDGKTLVTGDDSCVTIVWDVAMGMELRRWKVKQWIRALDISPDNKTVVTAENFPQLKFSETDVGVRGWDVQTGKLKFDVSNELKFGMAAVRFSDDGKHLAICQGSIDREGAAGKVFLLDPATGKKLRELNPSHQRGATDLAFHPDGKHLLTCGRDRLVKIWRLSDGELVRDLGKAEKGLSEAFHAISITPDGTLLAVADGGGQVVIYTLADRK